MVYSKNAAVLDYSIKSERLCIPFAIVANATPASKTNSNDLTGAMVLALEGQTAVAAAIDSGTNFTTPVDATGIFGILLYNLGVVAKLFKYEVIGMSSGTVAVTAKGLSSTGVTASGNIALSVDSSLDLSAVNLSAVVCVDYKLAE